NTDEFHPFEKIAGRLRRKMSVGAEKKYASVLQGTWTEFSSTLKTQDPQQCTRRSLPLVSPLPSWPSGRPPPVQTSTPRMTPSAWPPAITLRRAAGAVVAAGTSATTASFRSGTSTATASSATTTKPPVAGRMDPQTAGQHFGSRRDPRREPKLFLRHGLL